MTINRQHTEPVQYPVTRRPHLLTGLTSMPAGKIVPIKAFPLFREDGCRADMRISVEMLETHEILMNPVFLRITAYFVPWLAMDRFEGSRDQFERSYAGDPQIDGGSVIDFIETVAAGAHGSNDILQYLGKHANPGTNINTNYTEVYNAVVNFRRKNRSLNLALRDLDDETLAQAFWLNSQFQHVVPTFDDAAIDGEVPLNVINNLLPISGLGWTQAHATPLLNASVKETGNNTTVFPKSYAAADSGAALSAGEAYVVLREDPANPGFPDVFAELESTGVTVSLSNLELAKKTQAFAKMRERYEGIDDDRIIDAFMSGLRMPDEMMKQPWLLADKVTTFEQLKRYATDAANLPESAVSGGAVVPLTLRVPRCEVGGTVMVFAEALPEQLFERAADPWLHLTEVSELPDALRDTLDPQKVHEVMNGDIDTDHGAPNDLFGFEPLNGKFARAGIEVGGKFFRPTVDGTADVVRERLWPVEEEDPSLGPTFYLVPELIDNPFINGAVDPFEVVMRGGAVITGLTQFGKALIESSTNYDAVLAKAPQDRIDGQP